MRSFALLALFATTCAADTPVLVPQTGRPIGGSWDASYGLTYSPDGKTLALIHADSIILWDVHTRALKLTLVGHGALVYELAFTPDGRTLVSADGHSEVILWDAATGNLRQRLDDVRFDPLSGIGPGDKPHAPASKAWGLVRAALPLIGISYATPPGLASSARRGRVPGRRLAVSPDGGTIVTGYAMGRVVLQDLVTGKRKHRLDGHTNMAVRAAFTRDGRTLATTSWDRTAIIWDVTTGARRARLTAPPTPPEQRGGVGPALAFSPDGKTLATEGDGQIILWDAATGRRRMTLGPVHEFRTDLAFSPDGKALAAQGYGSVTLWDVTTGKGQPILADLTDEHSVFGLSPDGNYLATDCGGDVLVWDLVRGQRKWLLKRDAEHLYNIIFSPDGRTLFADGLWDLTTGQNLSASRQMGGDRSVFSPDGKTLADGDFLWDVATGEKQPLELLQDPQYPPTPLRTLSSAAFSPDGKTLAMQVSGGAGLWDATTGERKARFEGDGPGRNLAFSRDGKAVLSADQTEENTEVVTAWDAQTGKRLRTLPVPPVAERKVYLSPDGKSLVPAGTAGYSGYGQIIALLDERFETVSGPGGRDMAILLGDHGIALRDLPTGRTRATLYSFDGGKAWLIFTPEGYYTGSGNVGEYIRWLDGGKVYPASKYEARFHRPDLVAASLSHRP